jgi:hypothetical protein
MRFEPNRSVADDDDTFSLEIDGGSHIVTQ